MGKRLYSAVVDPAGVFPAQAQYLFASLTELAAVDPDSIVLHVVGDHPEPLVMQSLRSLGAHLVQVPPHPTHAWCNKLQQLDSLLSCASEDVVLLDCDVIVLEEPPSPTEGGVAAKAVDFAYPPYEVLTGIFSKAGVDFKVMSADIDGAPTALGNANGGLYVIDHASLPCLSSAWRRWANWCLENGELFGDFWMHVDQVAFALSISSEGIPFESLDRRFNVPTHEQQPPTLDRDPAILHYHRSLDEQQLLLPVADLPKVNEAIGKVNSWLVRRRRRHLDNVAFWNARYALHPELGSGAGSRGDVLEYKKELLTRVVTLLGACSVIDVGGGDGLTASALTSDVSVYALDVAASARAKYLQAVPRASWILQDISVSPPSKLDSDLVLCLDVLIHASEPSTYQHSLDNLLSLGKPLLVSGFDAEPVDFGSTTYFHEPLSLSLEERGWLAIPVGGYRGLTVFLATPEQETHGRDITDATLRAAVPFVGDPLVLLETIALARKVLGFFPNHLPRCIEYPWIAAHLPPTRSLRILDAGSGVSPLPLLLAKLGHLVVTVDPHPIVRTGTPPESWNEWGFLDYAELDKQITSLHLPYEETDPNMQFDAVVSVSVIEHLSSAVRRAWLETAASQLATGGRLLLTIDTVPFSDRLWNYSEGCIVEHPSEHGRISTIVSEIEAEGFVVRQVEHLQWLPLSRVGLARIEAVRLAAARQSSRVQG